MNKICGHNSGDNSWEILVAHSRLWQDTEKPLLNVVFCVLIMTNFTKYKGDKNRAL